MTRFSVISRRLVMVLLFVVFHDAPTNAGCLRTRCSGRPGILRDFKRTIDFVYTLSQLMSPLTFRAMNHTNVDFGVKGTSCNPTCTSPVETVTQEMNLTRSKLTNASRSVLLEFHRRVFRSYSRQVKASLVEIAHARNAKTHPAYLNSFLSLMSRTEILIEKAVKLDKKLQGVSPHRAGQQPSTAIMPNATMPTSTSAQSITKMACHFSSCVLGNLLIETYQMIVDFYKIKISL